MLRYIQSHCYNLGGDKPFQSRHINYVDGFAGAGKYDDGFGIEDFVEKSNFWKRYNIDLLDTDGSPLIALKCAQVFRAEKRVNLRCFFAEAHKKTNKELQANCLGIGNGVECKIYKPQRFDKTFPQIIEDLNEYPTIFFLDSFGVKGINFEQIGMIGRYVSRFKGELFLLFHNSSVARHAGYLTQKSDNERMKKIAGTYMQNLTKMLGPNSDEDWKPKWLELKDEPQQFERWALDYFTQRIANEGQFNGVASFDIKERYTDLRPMYSIVVGSNHPRKACGEFLNDFFADENKLLFYEVDKSKKNRNFLQQAWERQTQQRKSEIKPKIIQLLKQRNQQWKKMDDVITDLILTLGSQGYDLGYLKRSDYRTIMIELFTEGIIQTESLGKKRFPTLESKVKIV